ncbi:MAG: RNA pseudouridine synthase [Succinivibrio sp.]|nr:RNA pseudouridine synthase [Succinivibrio sp.]
MPSGSPLENFKYNPPKEPFLDILFHDEHIMVVNKPSGLLSVPGRLAENHDSIISRIQTMHPDAMAVHRLDMDTSGIMVVGLTKEAISNLGKQFNQKTVTKRYVALVDGIIPDEGEVNLPLRCDIENRPLQIVDFEQGKESRTLYCRLDNSFISNDYNRPHISAVKLIPVTGRSHQLRVHMAQTGHAILGDRFYASDEVMNRTDRLCLHAFYLNFSHPISGNKLEFTSKPEFLKTLPEI